MVKIHKKNCKKNETKTENGGWSYPQMRLGMRETEEALPPAHSRDLDLCDALFTNTAIIVEHRERNPGTALHDPANSLLAGEPPPHRTERYPFSDVPPAAALGAPERPAQRPERRRPARVGRPVVHGGAAEEPRGEV